MNNKYLKKCYIMQNSFYLEILFSNVIANFFFVVLHLKYDQLFI